MLNWKPVWNFEETLERTVAWYDSVLNDETSSLEITHHQINDYGNIS
jgi:dTDP-D-glucose 4,6-dehydratase